MSRYVFSAIVLVTIFETGAGGAENVRLESPCLLVEIDRGTGQWSLVDRASAARWPSEGSAKPGTAKGLVGDFTAGDVTPGSARLVTKDASVVFRLVDDGRSLELCYDGKQLGDIHALGDALRITDREQGALVIPCREGLWIPASGGVAFEQSFGTSEYEGCHMNMVGLVKGGSVLAVTWDDAYVWADVKSELPKDRPYRQQITTSLSLRGPARAFRLTPLGPGDVNTLAAGYRRIAEQKHLAVTLRDRIRRQPHAELLVGAANVKLWTCLERTRNEESTKDESVKVHWTFDEAASVAEHLRKDVGISRCLFTIGGWTEGGYDCRHPDNLPANPECGGNEALAGAVRRIQALGYVASLHDNYQDMYRDAKSWNPAFVEKRPDGSLISGGRWLGGRAYMVCAPKQLELASRPQNLPEIQRLFAPWSYFIDTTYAVGPRECADPDHRIGRNDDIAWKIRLSDKAREVFGLFGSECGREWALPHSDFFEGLTGVEGHDFHNLKPQSLGATAIPFWEMVYHDCQICYGKYGYPAGEAAEYVARHVLAARPLNYHSIPDHRYWLEKPGKAIRRAAGEACFTRTDRGWAAGLHPVDAFLKTTHEVLGPLHEATALDRLDRLEILTSDGTLRRARYGQGNAATVVVVNFGKGDAAAVLPLGGKILLPACGFAVEGKQFAAFYAKRWGGQEYPAGALFTLRATDGKTLLESAGVRVFHGFGDVEIPWRGKTHSVQREQVIAP
jgi:hypothetical protein